MIDGVEVNHTARGRLQWKKRWASPSTAPHVEQCSSMWLENLSAVASARWISLHVKALIMVRVICGEKVFGLEMRELSRETKV